MTTKSVQTEYHIYTLLVPWQFPFRDSDTQSSDGLVRYALNEQPEEVRRREKSEMVSKEVNSLIENLHSWAYGPYNPKRRKATHLKEKTSVRVNTYDAEYPQEKERILFFGSFGPGHLMFDFPKSSVYAVVDIRDDADQSKLSAMQEMCEWFLLSHGLDEEIDPEEVEQRTGIELTYYDDVEEIEAVRQRILHDAEKNGEGHPD